MRACLLKYTKGTLLTLLSLLVSIFPALSLASPTLTEYQATYRLRWNGMRVGTSIHIVQKIAKDQFAATVISTPSFAIAPFRSCEKSEFLLKKNQIRPLYYTFDNVEKGKTKKGTLSFDWKHKKIKVLQGLAHPNAILPEDAQDKITENLQLRLQLQEASSKTKKNFNYTVVERNRVRVYTFVLVNRETIQTPIGNLETVKFIHRSDHNNRMTIFWLAKDLQYLIVKMQHIRKNKIYGESTIEHLNLTLEKNIKK